MTNLVALDVVKPISIREVLRNSALAAPCRASDYQNVVVGGDGHFLGLGFVQDSHRLGW
jgi:hypothetical protein